VGFLFLVLYPLPHTHTLTHTDTLVITHTRQNWIFISIRWELNPFTCNWIRNKDLRKISSMKIANKLKVCEKYKLAIDIVPEIGNSRCRVLGLALRHDQKKRCK